MFVLGIDPGLSTTGYALVEAKGSRTQPINAGVIRTKPEFPVGERLAIIHQELADLLVAHVDEVAIEQVFTTNNRQTVIGVQRASGVVMLAATIAGCPVYEYTPTQVKAAVCGFGQADKQQVRKAVMMRLKLDELAGPPDAADALAVALCHLQGTGLARAIEAAG